VDTDGQAVRQLYQEQQWAQEGLWRAPGSYTCRGNMMVLDTPNCQTYRGKYANISLPLVCLDGLSIDRRDESERNRLA